MKQLCRIRIVLGLLLTAFLIFAASGCSDEDSIAPNDGDSVNTTIDDINSNINALKTLLAAKTDGKGVKSCTLVSDNTYNVELSDGNSVTVKTFISSIENEDSKTYFPLVSVVKEDDGYYWALDGTVLNVESGKLPALGTDVPVVGISDDNYWTITYGGETKRLNKVEPGHVKSLFSDVMLSEESFVKFVLRGETPYLTLNRVSSDIDPIRPTGVLRRVIDKDHPAWLVHIDVWNYPDPQAIIDLIPEDIRPYVIFNISFSVSMDDAGNFIKPVDGYNTAKSWLRVCAENNVWAMVQASSGGYCHWPDFENYADFTGSLFEEFYQEFPNFIGFNYAEQGWGFKDDAAQITRYKHFANLLKLSHEYGGYLVVSFFNPSWGAALNGVGIIKRCPELAEACKTYADNFIPCEKFTQTNSFMEMESTSLGVFLSGYAGNYGIRFDQCGWDATDDDGIYWNDETTFPPAAGALPVIEHMMFTGQAVMDGPELIWKQCFKEGGRVDAGDGYKTRSWGCYEQFSNISMDIYRKILDGTIRIMSRKEVIDRTKLVVVNDITPTGASKFDAGYAAPANLYRGLYLLDEDGTQTENRYWFKKTGRYPAIPVVANLVDDLARSFSYQIKASQFQTSSGWGDITQKCNKFNSIFPEEYTSNGMFAGRYENGWVVYNCYPEVKTASIPFKYNTCEKMELDFNEYSIAVVKEYSNSIDYYLNNYTNDRKAVTDIIRIYGCSGKPTYSFMNRISGNICSVSEEWNGSMLTLSVKHNGPLDLHVNCSGTSTNRETLYTNSNIQQPAAPDVYNGVRQYEAEYFEYKNGVNIQTNAAQTDGALTGFVGLGYLEFGTNTNAAVRYVATVNQSGSYSLAFRYCSPAKTVKTIALYVNGKQVAVPEFTATGSGGSWSVTTVPVSLDKGKNTIELKATDSASGELYLDYMTVEKL